MNQHESSWIITNHHDSSWIIMNHNEWEWIIMNLQDDDFWVMDNLGRLLHSFVMEQLFLSWGDLGEPQARCHLRPCSERFSMRLLGVEYGLTMFNYMFNYVYLCLTWCDRIWIWERIATTQMTWLKQFTGLPIKLASLYLKSDQW